MAKSDVAGLNELEASILEAMRTLDSLDEIAQPSEQPDNKGMAINLHKLVDNLSRLREASTDVDVPIPFEIVQAFVDEGRSPDEFISRQHAHAQQLSDDVRSKQDAMRQLARSVAETERPPSNHFMG